MKGLFVLSGFVLALLAGSTAIIAGFGSRWNWWHFRTGFLILRWAAYVGIAAAVLSVLSYLVTRHSLFWSIFGVLIGILTFGVPFYWWRTVQSVPPIHDITTDAQNPPRFVSILPLRKTAPNPVEYGGPEIAEKQRLAYPDIAAAMLPVPPDQAFERAYRTARKLGWEIVDQNPTEGRIEATDTTVIFGFKDDIVIRVAPADSGSRIDIRSVSRVGKSDVGTNAKRIRKYLKALPEE